MVLRMMGARTTILNISMQNIIILSYVTDLQRMTNIIAAAWHGASGRAVNGQFRNQICKIKHWEEIDSPGRSLDSSVCQD